MNQAALNQVPINASPKVVIYLKGALEQIQQLSGTLRVAIFVSGNPLTQTQSLQGSTLEYVNYLLTGDLTMVQTLRGNSGTFNYRNPLIGKMVARDVQLQIRK